MTAEDDMDSEDLELYGDTENEAGEGDSPAEGADNSAGPGNQAVMAASIAEGAVDAEPEAGDGPGNGTEEGNGDTVAAGHGVSGGAEDGGDAKAEGDGNGSNGPVREEVKGDAEAMSNHTEGNGGEDIVTGGEEEKAENGAVVEGVNGGQGDEEKEEVEKEGDGKEDSGDESGESDDSDEEEEDDDEQDDFEVILNVDGVDTATKPGTIGTVRLPPNKWQRPGYVPPERVSITPAQTGARPGGVLAMLPTPTQQFNTIQKSVYDLEIGKLTEKPWLERGADLSDYFNYGFNEETWKLYCERQMQMRLEASSLAKIKTVDGNRNQNGNANRPNNQSNQKHMQHQQNMGSRNQSSGGGQQRPANQNKMQPPPPPPPGAPGMMPPPPGIGVPPGAIPGMPGMPKMPNLPFPFPGVQNGKGGGFQPPFPAFLPMPGNQRKGDEKNEGAFPFIPGMPGMPMPPPGAMPPGAGPAGNQGRGFPGQMHTPHKGPQQGMKNMRGGQQHRSGMMDHPQGRGIKRPAMDQNSRFGPAQGMQNPHGMPMHPSRQGLLQGVPQGQHQGGHPEDDRRRWNNNRGMNDRRQGFDKSGGEPNHMGGDPRGRGGYDDRYGDRGHDRRRSWNDDGDRRRGGYDNQRYGDQRRDYDRDRDREHYRKRGPGRDYDDDRKRMRR